MDSILEWAYSHQKKLQEQMTKVESYNNTLYDRLSSSQSSVEQLAGVHDLLDTLHFLADLPDKLKASMAQEKWGEGVAYYKKTRPILDNFSHIASFTAIKTTSEKLIDEIRETLFSRFDDMAVCIPSEASTHSLQRPAVDVIKSAAVLQHLGNNFEVLRDRYLDCRVKKLREILEKWRAFVVNPISPDETPP